MANATFRYSLPKIWSATSWVNSRRRECLRGIRERKRRRWRNGNSDMEAIAKTKYLKGSPRKARLVIDLIRGTNVSRALSILKFTDKRAADPIAQCLNSSIANATDKAERQNIAIDPDAIWVKTS